MALKVVLGPVIGAAIGFFRQPDFHENRQHLRL
jgi:hypothetical protein